MASTTPRRSLLLWGLGGALSACGSRDQQTARAGSSSASSPTSALVPSASADTRSPKGIVAGLKTLRAKLVPLHVRSSKPQPGEWRYDHPETGQSFEQYLSGSPTVPDDVRRTLVVQPLGAFPEAQRKIVALVVGYMGHYFNLPVRMADAIDLKRIPSRAKRTHPTWGDRQILSRYVLDDVLKPALPNDAAAMLALTTSDLWPGQGWNFVFGEADLRARVGVWSVYRHGDPNKSREAFQRALRRAIGIAIHETGHMFSLEHCSAYKCVQAGVNSLEEADRMPLWLCPECMPKIVWATRGDAEERYRRLRDFCQEHGLDEEASFFTKSLEAIG